MLRHKLLIISSNLRTFAAIQLQLCLAQITNKKRGRKQQGRSKSKRRTDWEREPAGTEYTCTHTWLAADTYVSDRYTTQSLASPKFASVRVYNHPLLFNTFNTFRIASKSLKATLLRGNLPHSCGILTVDLPPALPWLECVLNEWYSRG